MPRLGCTPFSHRPRLRLRRSAATFAALLLAALGCREDAPSPTAPESQPALATAATTALAFYQMSAGRVHTCGVTTDNRLFCWGSHGLSDAALGDGTTNGSLTPVAIAGALRFRQVSASFSSTCGVTTDYRAYCWGDNPRGELGDGTTTTRLTPVPVAGGHLFRQVQTSFEHTCGLSYTGNKVYCWGWNLYGQLGDGTRTNRLTPVAVAGGHLFRQVTAGYYHSCGVTTDDRVFCWGWNRYGQVGDSSSAWLRLKPSQVAGTRLFRQVSAGATHTCAVTIGYRAFCWGNGETGQLGNGKVGFRRVPTAVSGGLSFDRVTAAAYRTCGESTGDRAYCWGQNGGVLGDGTTTNRLTPVAVVGGHTFAQVSAGGSHTCGKTGTSVGYCWGGNFYGELGDGTSTTRLTPVPVAGPI
jgi:alpha-tubulin suppressor-like RCC1 family protein